MFIDTHCHLFPEYDFVTMNPDKIVLDTVGGGVTNIWLASTQKQDIDWNFLFCNKYPENLKMWVGWHPEHHKSYDLKFLKKFINKNITTGFLVGVGEIGLDFKVHPASTIEGQIDVFVSQLEIAKEFNLPVAIHCRDAFAETLKVLSNYSDLKILWHCFNLNVSESKELLSILPNVYLAINSILTYKSGVYIKDSLLLFDNSKIVLETDSPFLIPRPFKYTFNTPLGVKSVYSKLAETLNIRLTELQKLITLNCSNLQRR